MDLKQPGISRIFLLPFKSYPESNMNFEAKKWDLIATDIVGVYSVNDGIQ